MAAINDISGTTNVELWNLARAANPTFESHTSEATAEMFTERGWEAITRNGLGTVNEFFETTLRIAFQMLNVSRAKNPLEGKGLLQVYSTPNGGYTQRMAVKSIKPISPGYHGLQNGDSPNPFVVKKPEVLERFFQMNFSYQSLISWQDFQAKPIFLDMNGVGQLLAGTMQGLANGYTIQEYENALECLNAAIHSVNYPLQDSQQVEITVADADNMTNEELTTTILAVKDLISAMRTSAQTGAYNAMKFATAYDTDDLVFVTRPSLKNRIGVNLLTGAIHPENLSLPIETIEIPNFGGLVAKTSEGAALYPLYSDLGEQIGWTTTEGGTTAYDGEVVYDDPNESILGIVCQRGVLFENKQNPYVVTPIYNPRGLYTNYWASSPNNAINYDPLYAMVVIKAVTE